MTNELSSLNEVIDGLNLGEGDYIFGFDYSWSRKGVVIFVAYVKNNKVAVTQILCDRKDAAVYEMWDRFNSLPF